MKKTLTFSFSDIEAMVGVTGRKLGDMTLAMQRIADEELKPLIAPAWARSGLAVRSGELKKAVVPWHKKRSAGIKLKTRRGKDLVLPKADTLQKGRAARAHKKHDTYTVKNRRGTKFARKNQGSPWGEIKPRVFVPQRDQLLARRDRIERILSDYLKKWSG